MDPLVRLDQDGPLATITLNRPDKLNALSPAMLDRMDEVLGVVESNPDVRVVVLTGAGERAFCAGADIKAWGSLAPLDMWRQWIPHGHRVINRLAALRQPVIAALNGMAFGGGLELALACDLRVCTDTARFAMPEVTIAAVPGWGGTDRLPQVIGPARAKALILTGKAIDANTALRWGLVTEVWPAEGLTAHVLALAETMASAAPNAMTMAKQLLDCGPTTPNAESLAGALIAHTKDAQEGVHGFTERRPPEFTGQ